MGILVAVARVAASQAPRHIDHDGTAGDRLVVVSGPHGLVTSRTRPQLLGLHTLKTRGRADRLIALGDRAELLAPGE